MLTHVHMHVSAHMYNTHMHQHIYIPIGIHTPCAQTLAFREAHRAPGIKRGLRQLTLLLLVLVGTLRRGRRKAGGLAP